MLVSHMRNHALLSREPITLMQPIEACLFDSFKRMKQQVIPKNKNYFAMSLKLFFMSLNEEELEFVCHNYIHNWINEELQRSNRILSKYQVEEKLNYIKQKQTNA